MRLPRRGLISIISIFCKQNLHRRGAENAKKSQNQESQNQESQNQESQNQEIILYSRQVGYSLPMGGDLPPEEKRRDLDSNLLNCDAVIVVYDSVSLVWVREQVLYCRRMDYLLTWNCRHIANANIQKQIRALSQEMGYEMPVICTPTELMGEMP